MFLPEGIPFKKMAKILKAPKFKSPQKKTAKFRRKLSTSVPSSRSLGIWVSPPGRQNGTNSHVDQVEKFGCFGSPAFIPNTEKTWLVVEPPLWKILVKWDYCFQYTGKKHVPNHQPETYTDPLKSWTMPDSSTPSGGKHGKTMENCHVCWFQVIFGQFRASQLFIRARCILLQQALVRHGGRKNVVTLPEFRHKNTLLAAKAGKQTNIKTDVSLW